MHTENFHLYAPIVSNLTERQIVDPQTSPELLMDHAIIGNQNVSMVYAPFDYINVDAKIVIVGMTPGRQQASNALRAAKVALEAGYTIDYASRDAKLHASFSGEPMRSNLIRMLDLIGVPAKLGLQSTSSLWSDDANLVHFTSALRYPVFVDGQNWSGQPDMVRTPVLRAWLEQYTGVELATLNDAIIVPLGPKVCAAMMHLADVGKIKRNKILEGLPHPSGANAERIACFLGDKPAELVSSKTNAAALYTARDALTHRVSMA